VPFSKCASGTGIVWSVRPGKACAGVIIPGVFRPNMLQSYPLDFFTPETISETWVAY